MGVFLSGGLDSSAITALAAKFHAHPVHTYSIHFGDPYPNELEFSGLVARHCGTQHPFSKFPLAKCGSSCLRPWPGSTIPLAIPSQYPTCC
ncbi:MULTISPECIES: asparagine synthase C-terminal domain-containing protein [Cyanophyceae]|uniref:asparagine synthase (glutamine-hydrolyzing) n=1 Tax=Leptolyngbya subtilissima DQ-A4 TaxID=2933933 RepID=A0ABV0KA18_9CYAN